MKVLKALLICIICISMIALVSCSDTPSNECTSHVDANGDQKCDNCEANLPKPECTEHKDENGDKKCDVCGVTVESDEGDKGCEHEDKNLDGKCDLCKETPEDAVMIFKDGATNYNFVVVDNTSSSVIKKIDAAVKDLGKLGAKIERLDKSAAPTDYEIIIGVMADRSEDLAFDQYSLGPGGYMIRVVGKRIQVVAGSDEGYESGVDVLLSDVMGISDGMKKIKDRAVYPSFTAEEIKNDFKITSISINGTDIKGFNIAIDTKDPTSKKMARDIQDQFYNYSGYRLEIVDIKDAERAIVLESPEKTGGLGFAITVEGTILKISCEFKVDFPIEVKAFFDRLLMLGKGDINIDSSYARTKNLRDVYYSSFGAKGDGKTDDFEAIRAAHEYANGESGHIVYADRGATYYIGSGHFSPAVVLTDTHLDGAKFIIDDTNVKFDSVNSVGAYERLTPIYSIDPTIKEAVRASDDIEVPLSKKATNIGFAPGFRALVLVFNSQKRQYIRYGPNQDAGGYQNEIILVDKDGNIDPSTPLMWDYDNISYFRVYYAEDKPLTFSGGEFTTIYNHGPADYNQYSRAIWIYRSNVTVENLSHKYESEYDEGGPSGGIVIARNCYNTLIRNVEVDHPPARYEIGSAGTVVGMGAYEFSAGHCVNITWQNCTQIDFWEDDTETYAASKGMMATSYCKNLYYIDNMLSSFDIHCGGYNVTVKGCLIEHINCIGAGNIHIEDTVIHALHIGCAVSLRPDYGSVWDGDATFKDVTLVLDEDNTQVGLFQANWENHDFGYPGSMPKNVVVDNLRIESPIGLDKVKLVVGSLSIAGEVWKDTIFGGENKYVYEICEKLTIKNNNQKLQFDLPASFLGITEVVYE